MVENNEIDELIEGAKTSENTYTPTIPNLIGNINIRALVEDEQKLTEFNAESPAMTKVFLVGMPSEIGVRARDGRAGAERGPETFREILQLCALPSNPVESSAKLLDTVKLYDCGNIEVNQG